jgi:hypothetical protein
MSDLDKTNSNKNSDGQYEYQKVLFSSKKSFD